MNKKAFIVRCSPSGNRQVEYCLRENQVVIGWSYTKDMLLKNSLRRDDFKRIIENVYNYNNSHKLGRATGILWRFIQEIQIGDYVILPDLHSFYVGEVLEITKYHKEDLESDLAIRRSVKWLNDCRPISKGNHLSQGFKNKLNNEWACLSVSEFIEEIENEL